MGWTGQTRRVMWTGQKPLPVRVNLRALLGPHKLEPFRVHKSLILYLESPKSRMLKATNTEICFPPAFAHALLTLYLFSLYLEPFCIAIVAASVGEGKAVFVRSSAPGRARAAVAAAASISFKGRTMKGRKGARSLVASCPILAEFRLGNRRVEYSNANIPSYMMIHEQGCRVQAGSS